MYKPLTDSDVNYEELLDGEEVLSLLSTMGTLFLTVELAAYVRFTDYATEERAGVVHCRESAGCAVGVTGNLHAVSFNLSEYRGLRGPEFISKGTLENIKYNYVMESLTTYRTMGGETSIWTDDNKQFARTLIGAIGPEDYAGFVGGGGGVIRTNSDYATDTAYQGSGAPAGTLRCIVQSLSSYQSGRNEMFISKGTLENIKYAYVKSSLSNSTETWTDNEKAKACATIGALSVADKNALVQDVISALPIYDGSVTDV